MAIFKVKKKTANFVVVANTGVQDERLSWRARGLLVYLLSLPDDWVVLMTDLVNRATEGRDALYTAINELKKQRYIVSPPPRRANGRFIKNGFDYHVFESPQSGLFIDGDSDESEEDLIKNSKSPVTESPHSGKPLTVNPHLQNINRTKYTKTKKTAANRLMSDQPVCSGDGGDKQSIAAAFHFLDGNDLSIGKALTENQQRVVQEYVQKMPGNGSAEKMDQLIQEIRYSLCDMGCFTQAGNDFLKKLNTIKKSIHVGLWTMPMTFKEAQEKPAKEDKARFLEELSDAKFQKDHFAKLLEIACGSQNKSAEKNYRSILDKCEQKIQSVMSQSISS